MPKPTMQCTREQLRYRIARKAVRVEEAHPENPWPSRSAMSIGRSGTLMRRREAQVGGSRYSLIVEVGWPLTVKGPELRLPKTDQRL
jgi:hypothetical protein